MGLGFMQDGRAMSMWIDRYHTYERDVAQAVAQGMSTESAKKKAGENERERDRVAERERRLESSRQIDPR